jgi:hypothetical protein
VIYAVWFSNHRRCCNAPTDLLSLSTSTATHWGTYSCVHWNTSRVLTSCRARKMSNSSRKCTQSLNRKGPFRPLLPRVGLPWCRSVCGVPSASRYWHLPPAHARNCAASEVGRRVEVSRLGHRYDPAERPKLAEQMNMVILLTSLPMGKEVMFDFILWRIIYYVIRIFMKY